MLVLRADGCSLCLALDVVEGVFEHPVEVGSRPASVVTVDWRTISGVDVGEPPASGGFLVVVRSASGPIGLRVDACLGVRDVSFLESPPIPTRLVEDDHEGEGRGHPVCYLLMVDGHPHFLLEPRALALAHARSEASNGMPGGISSLLPPQPGMGG